MSKLREIFAILSFATATVLVSSAAASAAPPVRDQSRVLIRVEGHQESFGTLASPIHSVTDYALAVTVTGQGALSVSSRRLTYIEPPESLDDPPRVTTTRFRLAAADLAHLQSLLTSAQIGQQQDCHSFVPFLRPPSASAPPKQRVVWFGDSRRHEFAAWRGDDCSPEIVSLLQSLAGIANAVYELPQER
jgi:hypothetical protein